jgi:hypothetical protein
MMQRQILHSVSIAVFLFGCVTASVGSADEWDRNPLHKSAWSRDSSPIYTNIASSEKTSWLPKWQSPKMPWSKSPTVRSYPKSKTSTWNQVSKTSKRWWNKATELLDPYPDPKPTKNSPTAGKPSTANLFTGMFQPKEPEKRNTLEGFLGQDRPK